MKTNNSFYYLLNQINARVDWGGEKTLHLGARIPKQFSIICLALGRR